jgi:hypothetical protein
MSDEELIAMLENVVDYQSASTECELAAARIRALIAERDAMTEKYNKAFWQSENLRAEVARLREAMDWIRARVVGEVAAIGPPDWLEDAIGRAGFSIGVNHSLAAIRAALGDGP